MSTDQSYDIVLNDLEDRARGCTEEINRRTEELKMLSGMIENLRRFMASTKSPFPISEAYTPVKEPIYGTPSTENVGRYAGMSVRWAILYLLAENATAPMVTSEIADALIQGGITSNAQRVAGNVSAVLSTMVNQRKEVERVGVRYQITPTGRTAWDAIKHTPQWLSRVAS